MMRQAVFVLIAGLSACGGSTPTTPSQTPPPTATTLSPGRYTFTVTQGTNGQPGLQPPCVIFGSGQPTGPYPGPNAAFVVIAESDGDGGLRLRPDAPYDRGWTMTLRRSGDGVEGTVRGTAQDMRTPQTVTIDGGGPAPDAARVAGMFGFVLNFVGGQVAGRVMFESGGYTYSCPNNDWVLNRLAQ